jgi:copper chaperone CopZ
MSARNEMFKIKGMHCASCSAIIEKTLKKQPGQGIAFNMAYVCDTVPVGSMVDLAAELIADTWNGMRRLKLRVVDLRVAL